MVGARSNRKSDSTFAERALVSGGKRLRRPAASAPRRALESAASSEKESRGATVLPERARHRRRRKTLDWEARALGRHRMVVFGAHPPDLAAAPTGCGVSVRALGKMRRKFSA